MVILNLSSSLVKEVKSIYVLTPGRYYEMILLLNIIYIHLYKLLTLKIK